ncbi:MAG TPA: DUF2723 domain-containing protein [Candidatus Gallibacteroides avistercoris]|uniref:DUF2723 domain-containing protein n=1 Tax=Candidatus Gallibacteroides avistercoris TaxID=2840833 RepID=A0A9D1M7L7_9BACT|nr:DUF2723 domain-containing protein [Candidatus Gallibacteroides avistercoris]
MKQYKFWNNLLGWVAFLISAVVYIMTLEPTASFWDCGEFIASAYKQEVGHPPGSPLFMLTGRFFANFTSDPSHVAYLVNLMSGLLSAGTILFLFWTITALAKKIIVQDDEEISLSKMIAILGSGMVGALVYAFSDTFWFSAVEGEVYAYSSFCTAAVFWLILKWESVADEPYAGRFLVLIAYLMGVGICVHQLNLLCIPAIVLVYYYKKYPNSNVKGSLVALGISFLIILFLLYGLYPGFIQVAGWFELFAVNVLGMPFNTGVVVCFFLTIGCLIWGVYETYSQKNPTRLKVSFILAVSLLGLPFLGGMVWLGILLIAALAFYLFACKVVPVKVLNTILVCLMVIFFGYSSYAIILIRASANTPLDENNPSDIFSLGRYISREQYGNNPLLFGRTFVSDVTYDVVTDAQTGTRSGLIKRKMGAPIWNKKLKSSPDEKDRYVITGYKYDYIYNPELDVFFPRMYSDKPEHINAYKEWSQYKGKPVVVAAPFESDSGVKTVMQPTFWENLRFFFDYQLNHMYWRYFMWNFSGRQNDIQGHGEVQHGKWITGFNFIDKHMVGDQETLPSVYANNKGRNYYYMMPLLLGIIGLLFQAYSGRKGIEGFWITFFLFFMTGIAIVIYLNQTPYQPRERDYAYAGSFYAYAIWVGLGVLAIAKGLNRILKRKEVAAAVASVLCLFVPVQMIGQNWDDHDRSGRYLARDFGMNYLSCVDENGIIFTQGDNDTFPLWYVQEVEGFRTDVRVCNLSYLQTDWYYTQMLYPSYTSTPLPLGMTPEQYAQGKRDVVRVVPRVKGPMKLDSAIKWMLSDDERTLYNSGSEDQLNTLPATTFTIPIDSATVVNSGTVSPQYADSIVKEMTLSYSAPYLTKEKIGVLSMLNSIANQGWDRSIYFASTVPSSEYVGLQNYLQAVGLAYRIAPINGGMASMDADKTYDIVMNKFKWGGMDEDPDVYMDENCRRMCLHMRLVFSRLVNTLIEEGKTEKALNALNLCMEKIPVSVVPMTEENFVFFGQYYFKLGQPEKAIALLSDMGDSAIEMLNWYFGLKPSHFLSVGQSLMSSIRMLHYVSAILKENGQTELGDKYYQELETFASAYDAIFNPNAQPKQ